MADSDNLGASAPLETLSSGADTGAGAADVAAVFGLILTFAQPLASTAISKIATNNPERSDVQRASICIIYLTPPLIRR
ncbi:hypothetical protein GCM10010981_29410 [Dyella nitratireducens]|uniref:Uncharacterized protein n=1 Tax=Dyella nitratireducens TaxID=1849580 RepID=A0ABQ1G7M7_9GAMM|nr:hypothetical protein GCM10010981_29410 [Dyella nitratireducens]GLQ40298.1 hypothetical protein GCM10007902_01470 [Dyella nitratireducens]